MNKMIVFVLLFFGLFIYAKEKEPFIIEQDFNDKVYEIDWENGYKGTFENKMIANKTIIQTFYKNIIGISNSLYSGLLQKEEV